MRINIYAHLIIIEILDEIYARAQKWSSVEYQLIEQLNFVQNRIFEEKKSTRSRISVLKLYTHSVKLYTHSVKLYTRRSTGT
jgi:hypothetical protein